jgi:hypothetical protein
MFRLIRQFASKSNSEFSKHATLLSSLGLGKENQGVYNGRWGKGRGPLVHSVNPATNQIIASTWTGNAQDLQDTLSEIEKVKPMWKSVGFVIYFRCLLLSEEK